MSNRSYPYAVSRIKASEYTLIDTNTWTRIWEASIKDALRLLHDMGYGSQAEDQSDIDDLTQASVTQARELINEITPDYALTNLFLYQVDGHNIKAILKGLLQREEVDDILLSGGTIPLEELKEAFEADNFSSFPEKLRNAVEAFEPSETPEILSAKIDAAVYDQINFVLSQRKNHNPLCIHYFKSKIDFTNILSVLRALRLHWNREQVEPMILSGGDIDPKELLEVVGSDETNLADKLAKGEFSEQIAKALTEYERDHSIFKVENKFSQLSFSIIHEDYMDSFGIGPILNYLLQKEFEARTLRVLFALKRSGKEMPLTDLGVLA